MFLFGKKNMLLVVGGIAFCHLLIVALCVFFVYKFLIVSKNADVFLLLILLAGPMVICDVLALKTQAFSRFLIRCMVDSEGIHCSCLWRKWHILWREISIFGITGFSAITQTGIVFLSSDSHEKYQQNMLTHLSNKRIVFLISEGRWETLSEYMPVDMKKKLERAIKSSQDCYYRY